MSRLDQFWGAGDVDKMFGGSPMTVTPWPRAGGRKDVQDYDPERVRAVLLKPDEHELVDIDPRHLSATQPMITRAGVQHYMPGGGYEISGRTFADRDNPGNQYPMVYHRAGNDQLLLSGHHRAAAALLQGRQFKGFKVEGPWGPPR
jgi:hypothetical protein